VESICLVNTTFNTNRDFRGSTRPLQPIELIYIFEAIRENYKVQILDTSFIPDLTKKLPITDLYIISSSPNYLFWRCPPLNFDSLWALISSIRKVNKNAIILLIGPHGHWDQKMLFKSGVDYILSGEPELTISAFIRDIFAHKAPKYLHSSNSPMDELPLLNYQVLENRSYDSHNAKTKFQKSIIYEASRGCGFSCKFCNRRYFRGAYREKTTGHIIQELNQIFSKEKIDYIYFIDENFGFNKQWLKAVCSILQEFEVKWGCQTSADKMDAADLELMSISGCVSIEFGIESGADNILKTNKREVDLDKVKCVVEYASYLKLNPLLFLLFFLPGETEETIHQTIDFLKKIKNEYRISCGIPYPYPGTELWELGVQEGKIIEDTWREVAHKAGHIGHSLLLDPDKLQEFCDTYGPNIDINDDVLEQLNKTLKLCITHPI
jgi:radical SAM superfamily enzyme YgiQ (UPF0313 family)